MTLAHNGGGFLDLRHIWTQIDALTTRSGSLTVDFRPDVPGNPLLAAVAEKRGEVPAGHFT